MKLRKARKAYVTDGIFFFTLHDSQLRYNEVRFFVLMFIISGPIVTQWSWLEYFSLHWVAVNRMLSGGSCRNVTTQSSCGSRRNNLRLSA